ncbi:MAG: hypothetical protein KBD64_03835 [Gammaproteobacteria bacterium]|nr:hypothetical protein [Gammaproteobacteria bacterium]
MKQSLRKLQLFLSLSLITATSSFADEINSPECLKRSDQSYQKLIVGKWQMDDLMKVEFGSSGLITLTLYDTTVSGKPPVLYNEAYGYFDIKNATITTTFYGETNSQVGLANGTPHLANLNCIGSDRVVITVNDVEYNLSKVN